MKRKTVQPLPLGVTKISAPSDPPRPSRPLPKVRAQPMSAEDIVLNLYNVRKHRVAWIAEYLRCSPQNVYNHLRRAREAGKYVRPSKLKANSKMSQIRKHPEDYCTTGRDELSLPETLTSLQRVVLGIMVRQPNGCLSFEEACSFYWQTIRSLFQRGLIGLTEVKGRAHFALTDRGRFSSNCSLPLELVLKEM